MFVNFFNQPNTAFFRLALSKLKKGTEANIRNNASVVFKYYQPSKFKYRPHDYPKVMLNSVAAAAASSWNKRLSSYSLQSLHLPSTSPYNETGRSL
ncbi:hypothetical protein CDAR_492831 [Caerostris darwini]|uniref:Uncharacterized protein n=1 Tax=Caerostris darwini TaxID=1538125 RepID=A0AAV4TP61_9ARAC|nr:hypothetical protein CDAR_492831 [Caerostris darwini]